MRTSHIRSTAFNSVVEKAIVCRVEWWYNRDERWWAGENLLWPPIRAKASRVVGRGSANVVVRRGNEVCRNCAEERQGNEQLWLQSVGFSFGVNQSNVCHSGQGSGEVCIETGLLIHVFSHNERDLP